MGVGDGENGALGERGGGQTDMQREGERERESLDGGNGESRRGRWMPSETGATERQ